MTNPIKADDFITEALTAASRAGLGDTALFWYCPKCDSTTDPNSWRIVVAGGPLMDADGVARCPDCGGELVPVPAEVLSEYGPTE